VKKLSVVTAAIALTLLAFAPQAEARCWSHSHHYRCYYWHARHWHHHRYYGWHAPQYFYRYHQSYTYNIF